MNYKSIVTTVGASRIADCILRGESLNIRYAVAGDGGGTAYEPNVEQTTLVNEIWRGDIASSSTNPNDPNVLDVKFIISETVSSFVVREIGLISESGELVAIANVPEAEKALPENGASNKLTYVMHLVVADSSVISVTINAAVDSVSPEELEAAIKAHNDNEQAHSSLPRVSEYTVAVDTSWTTDNTYGGYYKRISVIGILATDAPIVDVVLGTDIDANALYLDAWQSVTRVTTAANAITLWANGNAPMNAFTLQLKVVR